MFIFVVKATSAMKPKTSSSTDIFKNLKSYSPEEVLAAGGTTAFGINNGEKYE